MGRVYICSPYRGDTEANARAARAYCRMAFDAGHDPVAPHLFYPQFTDDNDKTERDMCLALARRQIGCCSEMWVFGAPSAGMRAEIKMAEELGMLVTCYNADAVPAPEEALKPAPAARTKKMPEAKHKCGEFGNVLLTNAELEKLREKFPSDWEARIDKLSLYLSQKKVSYASHYATILNWARRDAEQEKEKRAGKKSHFISYEQRRYSDSELAHIGLNLDDSKEAHK